MYQLGKLYSLINEKSREDEEKVGLNKHSINKTVKEENTLINIAICDDDLVFASKMEAIS